MDGLGFGLRAEFAIAAGESEKSAAARRAGVASGRTIGLRSRSFW